MLTSSRLRIACPLGIEFRSIILTPATHLGGPRLTLSDFNRLSAHIYKELGSVADRLHLTLQFTAKTADVTVNYELYGSMSPEDLLDSVHSQLCGILMRGGWIQANWGSPLWNLPNYQPSICSHSC